MRGFFLSALIGVIAIGAGCGAVVSTNVTATPPEVQVEQQPVVQVEEQAVVQDQKPVVDLKLEVKSTPVVAPPVEPKPEVKTEVKTPTVKSFTAAEVAAHSTKSDCYTIIRGEVYNLTSWISQHPGGEQAIFSLCGKDGTAAFSGQHGGSAQQEKVLATFKIGVLAK